MQLLVDYKTTKKMQVGGAGKQPWRRAR